MFYLSNKHLQTFFLKACFHLISWMIMWSVGVWLIIIVYFKRHVANLLKYIIVNSNRKHLTVMLPTIKEHICMIILYV